MTGPEGQSGISGHGHPAWAQDDHIWAGQQIYWAQLGSVDSDGDLIGVGLRQEGQGPIRIWIRKEQAPRRPGGPFDPDPVQMELTFVAVDELIEVLRHAVRRPGLGLVGEAGRVRELLERAGVLVDTAGSDLGGEQVGVVLALSQSRSEALSAISGLPQVATVQPGAPGTRVVFVTLHEPT